MERAILAGAQTFVEPSQLIESLGTERRRAVFDIQTEILRDVTMRLIGMGFTWILPIMLSRSTDPLWPDPEASIEKRIELDIYGERVRTMQSMILHKRVLVSLGPERFFILSPNIRIEKRERSKTGRHLYEFTQLEIEVAKARMDDIFRTYEELIKGAIASVKGKMKRQLLALDRDLTVPEIPFPVMKRRDLEFKYGSVWQDEAPQKLRSPFWVTDLPREFYDFEDDVSGEWRNYDLFLPEGYGEVISGAEREYEYSKILKKLERDRLRKEEYEIILRLARLKRLKPSAGAGLGIERFVAYVCGLKHVAEAQPFPRVPGYVTEL
jgi:asparaginyl-tRNA synthetase